MPAPPPESLPAMVSAMGIVSMLMPESRVHGGTEPAARGFGGPAARRQDPILGARGARGGCARGEGGPGLRHRRAVRRLVAAARDDRGWARVGEAAGVARPDQDG